MLICLANGLQREVEGVALIVERRKNDKSFGSKSVTHVVMRRLMLKTSCLRLALVNSENEVDVPRYLIERDPIEYANQWITKFRLSQDYETNDNTNERFEGERY